MSRYLQTAAEANKVARSVLSFVQTEVDKAHVAGLLASLVNLGIRCSPRGVQHTVRLNAVREAIKDLPVKVSMVEKVDEKTKRTYHALRGFANHSPQMWRDLTRIDQPLTPPARPAFTGLAGFSRQSALARRGPDAASSGWPG